MEHYALSEASGRIAMVEKKLAGAEAGEDNDADARSKQKKNEITIST
jgi:hypothetical protein